MKALVIDDSTTIRRLIAHVVIACGFAVVESDNAGSAFDALLGGEVPDLILVDWRMPGMDGCEFVVACRSEPRLRDVPIIMISSDSHPASILLALEAGASDFLMKPFTRTDLEQKLALVGLAV